MSNDLSSLKGLVAPSIDHFWQAVCHPLINVMNIILNRELGPRETCVGVFGDPHHFPRGIEWVLVNGVVTIEKEKHTGALAGKVLRKQPTDETSP